MRSEEHTSELQSRQYLVCRPLLESLPVRRAVHSFPTRRSSDLILISRSAIEGERKQVTVLFADLKGSMELIANRDPEEARKLLERVVERMIEAVHRYEGTVNNEIGRAHV